MNAEIRIRGLEDYRFARIRKEQKTRPLTERPRIKSGFLLIEHTARRGQAPDTEKIKSYKLKEKKGKGPMLVEVLRKPRFSVASQVKPPLHRAGRII